MPVRLLLILLTLFPAISLQAQQFNYIHYDTKDGLPGATVYDVCQDKDGFMWFATENGLSRFDGTNFKNFTVKDGLPDNEVLKIYCDRKNRLWISTFSKELCYYYNGHFYDHTNDSIVAGIKLSNLLEVITEDSLGNLYFCDAKRITSVSKTGKIDIISESPGFPKNGSYVGVWTGESSKGIVYFSNDQSIYLRQDTGYKLVTTLNRKNTSANTCFFGYDFSNMKNRIRLPAKIVNVNFGNSGTAFVNTVNGVWEIEYETGIIKNYFLPGFLISHTAADIENNIWFTSLGQGVFKLTSLDMQNISLPSQRKAGDQQVWALQKDKTGSIIAGMGFSRLAFIRNRAVKSTVAYEEEVNKSISFSSNNISYSIVVMPDGTIFSAFNSFILKLKNNKPSFDFKIRNAKSLAIIDDNNLLVGTARYALRMRTSDMSVPDTLWRERCSKVFFFNYKYYVGTLNGLYELHDDKSYRYLGDYHPALKRRITDMLVTPDSTLWIATNDHGIVAYKNDKITSAITDDKGLSSNICKSLFYDGHYLWAGTSHGLNRIDLQVQPYAIRKYTTTDGLPSDMINTVYVDKGVIYLGTPAGLTCFNEDIVAASSICNLKLLEISSSGRSLPTDSSFHLSSGDNNIRFGYTAISMKSGGDIIYHYRIKGLNNEWQTTRETNLDYQSLPGGNYELELYAENKYGIKSQLMRVSIQVDKPFWATWWFYSLVVAIAVLLTGWLVNRRNYKKRLLLEEKNQVQQQFAALEQQALQAQMNPHFIFNCLNSIQQYILTNNKPKANEYLTGFASLIRQTLDNSGKRSITVAEEIRYLTQYLEMEKMRFGDKFTYTIKVDPSIDTHYTEVPALLLQPYVENAIRHGIRYRENEPGNVTICFEPAENGLRCRVIDNGVGRKKAMELKSKQHIEYQSRGMQLTGKRIELLNKINDSHITVLIKDLTNPDGTAAGTEVILNIPV